MPQLMENPEAGDDKEREIFNALRSCLNDEEWLCLPKLICELRAKSLRKIENDELLKRKERQQHLRQLEEDRLHKEKERLKEDKIKEQLRHEAERSRKQRRLEEEKQAKAELEKQILEEKKQRLHKRIASFLEDVKTAAMEGKFDVGIPDALADVIDDGAYNNALHAGSRIYFQGSIQDGDIINYDSLEFSIPNSLKQIHQEIKAKYVSQAIEIATKIRLDNEQLNAVLADDKVMKVTARAGSGKTRVLVAKAFYLIKFYKVNPDSILLLAFNRNAAREIQDRLKSLLEIDAFYTARTFHSLAYQISKPESELVMSDADPAMDKVGRIIQEILRGLWDGDIDKSVYTFFRNEAREYKGLGLHLSGEKFYKFRRSLPQATLRGDTVRSHGEKFIADYLFEHGIGYQYEPPFRMGSEGVYRPDFGIWVGEGPSRKKFVWEHWAFNPDGSCPSRIDGWSTQEIKQYREDVFRKRNYWVAEGWFLIETHAGMLGEGRDFFESYIQRILAGHGIKHRKLSQTELLQRVEVNLRSRLSRLLSQFVSRALSSECDIETLLAKIAQYTAEDEREQFFLKLGAEVLGKYLIHLEENQLMDFSLFFAEARDVLSEIGAIPLIHASGGNMIDLNALRYVFVDEAQDMSPNYLLLLQSLDSLLPHAKMMFVGDDWQAINRFAGADVNLFIELNKHYGETSGYALKKNYRSRKSIVEAGNLLMGGNSIEHSKAMKWEAAKIQSTDIDSVWLEFRKEDIYKAERQADQKFLWGKSPDERWRNDSGEEKARLVKLIFSVCKSMLGGTGKIAVLFRSNKFKGSYIDAIRDKVLNCFHVDGCPRNQIDNLASRLEFSTAHRSKGKEYDTVFIVSPHYGAFPMMHSDAQLFRFFGESPEQALEDEKRLFYVAITRAERRLIFLKEASKSSESPFMADLEGLASNVSLRQLCS